MSQKNPTIFSLDGSLMHFEDGTIYELHLGVNKEEWSEIVTSTVQFKIFLDCLKSIAFPMLHETWTAEDEWWRLQLEESIKRIKIVDPMAYVSNSINED